MPKLLTKLIPLALSAAIALTALGATVAHAQKPAATPPAAPAAAPAADGPLADAMLEQRVSDIEQYFQNLGVGAAGDAKWKSKISDIPGPGHNGWMMTSAALVLFMTLPGLALFYGGLVRKKNVLSVCAQCLGC